MGPPSQTHDSLLSSAGLQPPENGVSESSSPESQGTVRKTWLGRRGREQGETREKVEIDKREEREYCG